MMQVKKGIFKYFYLMPYIPDKYRISFHEGETRLIVKDGIYFKCEYENPTGSVKDRSIAFQISVLKKEGIKEAVISSSGNAGISAAFYCQKVGISLTVFVSEKINPKKLEKIKYFQAKIISSKKPVSSSVLYARKYHCYCLRQSTDQNALYGYQTIAYELIEEKPEIDALFIPVSSGTTFCGIGDGFIKIGKNPALHIVQNQAVNPIASLFDHDFRKKKASIADALVARFTKRQDEVIKLIKKSLGWGWVVNDEEILRGDEYLTKRGISCSYEGGAVLAALWKAKQKGFNYRYPVCLLTGKKYSTES